ncbi:MAG: hypothetical protein LH629_07130, partial [Ignavibacteria bacterium]|nr:hypothetical protein [Ignavibacteria bacterium]
QQRGEEQEALQGNPFAAPKVKPTLGPELKDIKGLSFLTRLAIGGVTFVTAMLYSHPAGNGSSFTNQLSAEEEKLFNYLEGKRTTSKPFYSGEKEELERLTMLKFPHGRPQPLTIKPAYDNPGHHDPNSQNFRGGGSMTEIIPDNAEELYQKAIPDETGKNWYNINNDGVIHRFSRDHNGTVHWNGSEQGARGLHSIPNNVRKRLQINLKNGSNS